MQETDWAALEHAARQAMRNAHAPYSGIHVGAAVRTADGRTFAGCNVENASYGLTICAERNAVFQAVAAGAKELEAVVVVCDDVRNISPCGACRQVLAEFGPGAVVRYPWDGEQAERPMADLLPDGFQL